LREEIIKMEVIKIVVKNSVKKMQKLKRIKKIKNC
jgi:hypothetical protein